MLEGGTSCSLEAWHRKGSFRRMQGTPHHKQPQAKKGMDREQQQPPAPPMNRLPGFRSRCRMAGRRVCRCSMPRAMLRARAAGGRAPVRDMMTSQQCSGNTRCMPAAQEQPATGASSVSSPANNGQQLGGVQPVAAAAAAVPPVDQHVQGAPAGGWLGNPARRARERPVSKQVQADSGAAPRGRRPRAPTQHAQRSAA